MAKTPLSTLAQFAPCVIYIRGKVAFSRVTSRVDGQELLEQQNKEKGRTGGRIIHTKPYMFITINNPVILDNGKLPQQVKQVIQERFFTRQDGSTAYTQESKSPYLPTVLYSAEVPELKGQGIANSDMPLPAELASGLDVTIGADLYSMKSYGTVGLGLKYILLNEPVQYFTRNSVAGDLDELGINYTPATAQATMPVAPAPVQAPQYTAPAYTAPSTATPVAEQFNGYPQTVVTPAQTPVAPAPVQPQYAAPQYSAPVFQPMQSAPIMDSDIPFNQGSMSPSLGVEPQQQIQRPVRYY